MKPWNSLSVLAAALVIGSGFLSMDGRPAAAVEPVTFSGDVVPILKARCLDCHQPDGEGFVKSGLDVSTYAGLMKGTAHGPIVVPGDAMTSNLNVLVEGRADPSLRMPHNSKPLTTCEKDILRRWVNHGAKND